MFLSTFRTAKGRRPRSASKNVARLRLTTLESRTTPTVLFVGGNFDHGHDHDHGHGHGNHFDTIQAAVDAAHPHDRIIVFPGTYDEAVSITKSDVDLMAVGGPGSVRIEAPSGADIAVQVAGGAHGVDITGFTIVGANAGIQFGTHFDSPASDSGSGSAFRDTIFGYAQVGIVVIGTGSNTDVVGNTVRGPGLPSDAAPIGIQVSDGARADVVRNNVSGNQGNSSNEGVGILVFQTSHVSVENNFIFGNDEGILLAAFEGSPRVTNTEVEGNVSFSNTFNGIGLVNADNNEIERNTVYANGFDGINVGSDPNDPNALPGTAVGNEFEGNVAYLNGRAGIFLESTATGNTVTKNRLHNNNTNNLATGADAVDLSTGTGTAGTANTWRRNNFGTSNPAGLH